MENGVINVLLIDDDGEYAKVTEHLLSRFRGTKFNLVWKRDGDSGIQELQSNPSIDIILMDYFLPGNNGIEVVKEFTEHNIKAPVIFLTSHKNFEVAVEAMRHGVYGYLVKDEASDTVLPQTILSVLEHVRVHKQIAEVEKQQMLARKRAEAIQELIIAISHEINNPLAAIKISADIISRQQLNDEERVFIDVLLQKINILEKELTTLRNSQWTVDTENGNDTVKNE